MIGLIGYLVLATGISIILSLTVFKWTRDYKRAGFASELVLSVSKTPLSLGLASLLIQVVYYFSDWPVTPETETLFFFGQYLTLLGGVFSGVALVVHKMDYFQLNDAVKR